MYRAFFGFREKPFNLTPDPKFLYLNASYREALAALHYGVVDRKGFVSLIGEAGTGKTTLLRRLLADLPRDTRSVLVINPAIGFEEMLRFILSDLGRPPAPGATKLDMLEVLNGELLDTLARGGNVVVLIDEAQDLTIPVLEELRLLSNLETAKEKILQLVLAGQPEFDTLLARSEIRQLRQRISVRARLRPLARSEVKAYVGARIAAAGGDVRGLFTRGALFRLWWFSGGVPRLVNAACDNALVNAYAAGRRTIRWREVGEAMRDLRRQVSWAPGRLKSIVAMLAAAATGAGLVLGVLWFLHGGVLLRPPVIAPPPPMPQVTSAPAVVVPPPIPPTPTVMVEAIVSPNSGPAATTTAVVPSRVPTSSAEDAGAPVPAVVTSPTAEPTQEAQPTPAAPSSSPTDEPTAGRTPSPEAEEARRIRVSEGDNLTELARHYYGNATPRTLAAIRAANPWLDDPNVIWVGKVLVLPVISPSPAVSPESVDDRR
ncbi:MAG: AAA family ATPase [Candidatus Binatia bacterium]